MLSAHAHEIKDLCNFRLIFHRALNPLILRSFKVRLRICIFIMLSLFSFQIPPSEVTQAHILTEALSVQTRPLTSINTRVLMHIHTDPDPIRTLWRCTHPRTTAARPRSALCSKLERDKDFNTLSQCSQMAKKTPSVLMYGFYCSSGTFWIIKAAFTPEIRLHQRAAPWWLALLGETQHKQLQLIVQREFRIKSELYKGQFSGC